MAKHGKPKGLPRREVFSRRGGETVIEPGKPRPPRAAATRGGQRRAKAPAKPAVAAPAPPADDPQ